MDAKSRFGNLPIDNARMTLQTRSILLLVVCADRTKVSYVVDLLFNTFVSAEFDLAVGRSSL